MTVTTLESTEVREKWAKLLETTAAGEADVVVTRSGEPMIAMIRYEDYLTIQDELEDARLARHAAAVLADLDAGKTDARPWEEIRAEWIAEGIESDN